MLQVLVVLLLIACPASALALNVDELLAATQVVREMDETALVALVPLQSGLQYVGCPNCDAGRQERQLTWSVEHPDHVVCSFCDHRFPSETYPMNKTVDVSSPRGEPVQFAYWADETGYRYFFKARRDDEVRKFLANQALKLAQLSVATGDETYSYRAAVLIDRFAEVFPSWCYHYDYPFRQKEIYDGDVPPDQFRPGFRTARWNWWAYHDIPIDLAEAFSLIRTSDVLDRLSQQRGVDVAHRIEYDLLRNAGDQVIANRDDYTNMSPSAWRSLVRLGRILNEPRYVHEVVRRFKKLMELRFFYDGFWSEGAPSYALQTISNLETVLRELHGYNDPPGYVDPIDGVRFDQLELADAFPLLDQARAALARMTLPNGRFVPVHDTWATAQRAEPRLTERSYLLPALGHACLVVGDRPTQSQWHLSWSGGYGHQHADVLSLFLFSHDRELLSDLGYSHTAYRSWTVSTAAHNTVVIDGVSQFAGSRDSPTDGSLLLADMRDPRVQVVRAEGRRAYRGLARGYRRTMAVVDAGQGRCYAVDLFEVEGGQTHDFFLHGNANEPARVTTDLQLKELPTLLPNGFDWKPTHNEGETRRAYEPHYAYGFLRNLRSTSVREGEPLEVNFHVDNHSEGGLQVTLWPESHSQLVLGENPSIRGAGEDDSQLDDFQRPFMLLRHRVTRGVASESPGEPPDGLSRFVSLVEPYGTSPCITSARRIDRSSAEGPHRSDGAIVLQIEIGERTDTIVMASQTPQEVSIGSGGNRGSFRGDVGLLSVRHGAIEHAYAIGEGGWRGENFALATPARQQTSLWKTASDALIVDGDGVTPPDTGEVIRLIASDQWIYPYHVKSSTFSEGGGALRIEVDEGPAVEFDAANQRLQFTSFPQREHMGPVRVQWQSSASWQQDPPTVEEHP